LLAREAREWEKAERLQGLQVEWARKRAALALTLPVDALDGRQRNAIRSLAASLAQLGQIQREQGSAACVASYKEATECNRRIGDQPGEAITTLNLGHAYMAIAAIRDLAQAEHRVGAPT
jgi:hypothetical protein